MFRPAALAVGTDHRSAVPGTPRVTTVDRARRRQYERDRLVDDLVTVALILPHRSDRHSDGWGSDVYRHAGGAVLHLHGSPTSPAFDYHGGIGTVSAPRLAAAPARHQQRELDHDYWRRERQWQWRRDVLGGVADGAHVAQRHADHRRADGDCDAGRRCRLVLMPVDGENAVATSSFFIWTFVNAAPRYVLTIGRPRAVRICWIPARLRQRPGPSATCRQAGSCTPASVLSSMRPRGHSPTSRSRRSTT